MSQFAYLPLHGVYPHDRFGYRTNSLVFINCCDLGEAVRLIHLSKPEIVGIRGGRR
jgi:hypothetical protein